MKETNYKLDLNMIVNKGVICDKPLVLTKTSEPVSEIQDLKIVEYTSQKRSELILSSVQEFEDIASYLPFILTRDNGSFIQIEKNIPTLIEELKKELATNSTYSFENMLEKIVLSSDVVVFPLALSVFVADNSFHFYKTAEKKWTHYNKNNVPNFSNEVCLESYVSSPHSSFVNKTMFLNRNIKVSKYLVFDNTDGSLTALAVDSILRETRQELLTKAIQELDIWLPIYMSVKTGNFRDYVLDLTGEL